MTTWLDAAAWVLAVSGCAFVLIGAVGMLRMPDFTTRAHAASLIDVFGTMQIIGALALAVVERPGADAVALKLVLIIVFLLVTAPAAIHAIFKTYLKEHAAPDARSTDAGAGASAGTGDTR